MYTAIEGVRKQVIDDLKNRTFESRYCSSSLLRSRLSGCHATLPLSGERCVTSRKTAAKETTVHQDVCNSLN